MKKQIAYLLVATVLLVFLFLILYLSPLNLERWSKMNTVGQKMAYTISSMRKIAFVILTMIDTEEYQHPIENQRIVSFAATILKDDSELKYSEQKRVFYDAWNTPILISYEKPAIYKFVSIGPNKQNDYGKGDDIVRVFDLSDNEMKLVE